MSDLTPIETDRHQDLYARRAVAEQRLSDAVLEWLQANDQIPAGRDIAAVDYAVPFTAHWFTTSGRVSRRIGTIVPPDAPDIKSLGDMILRRAQTLRDPLYDIDRLNVEPPKRPVTRHSYTPGCVIDHSLDPVDRRRCWVSVGSGYQHYDSQRRGTEGEALEVWAHQVTTPEGIESRIRVKLLNRRTGQAMNADLTTYDAHRLAEDVAETADRLEWTERGR